MKHVLSSAAFALAFSLALSPAYAGGETNSGHHGHHDKGHHHNHHGKGSKGEPAEPSQPEPPAAEPAAPSAPAAARSSDRTDRVLCNARHWDASCRVRSGRSHKSLLKAFLHDLKQAFR